MKYFDFYTYQNFNFLLVASNQGLLMLELFTNQNLDDIKHDKVQMLPYINYLDAYFNHKILPKIALDLKGTSFQLAVWHYLQTIPYGKTVSYKDVACGIGKNKAYQAVGSAIGKNPVMIVIPCHRVINHDGRMGGFSSDPKLKVLLLSLEKQNGL